MIGVGATRCTACISLLGATPKSTRNADWKPAWRTADGEQAAPAPAEEVVTVIRPADSLLIAGRPPVMLVGIRAKPYERRAVSKKRSFVLQA